ncbi:hypothetical protein H8959_010827, partial [Pygathrix nigripes]
TGQRATVLGAEQPDQWHPGAGPLHPGPKQSLCQRFHPSKLYVRHQHSWDLHSGCGNLRDSILQPQPHNCWPSPDAIQPQLHHHQPAVRGRHASPWLQEVQHHREGPAGSAQALVQEHQCQPSVLWLQTDLTQCLFPIPTTVVGPLLVPFILNFTITNLQYEEDMHHPGSRKFNTTERVLQGLLGPIFKNTSVGPLYSDCRLISLRKFNTTERVLQNLVSALPSRLCPDPDIQSLLHQIHAKVMKEDSTNFTPSLREMQTPPTKTAAGPLLVPFTLNFTITNLKYEEDMRRPGSRKFNTMERVLQSLLGPMLKNTSVGLLYSGCRLTLLSMRRTCITLAPGSSTPRRGSCRIWLVPCPPHCALPQIPSPFYIIDAKIMKEAAGPLLVPFTLNFTITNLQYEEDMHHPGSRKFNTTERVLQGLVSAPPSSLCPTPDTAVPLLVPFTLNFTITNLQYGEDMHHPGSRKFNTTERVLQGLVSAPSSSLCPDPDTQCLLQHPSQAAGPLLVPFTLNFTITNLQYEEDMHRPGSRKFNTTERVLQAPGPLLIPFILNFTITNLHYEENMQHPGSRKFNTTERVLQGLCLFLTPTTVPGPLLLPFTLNFTITNLQYEEAMQHPGSRKFNTTERILQGLSSQSPPSPSSTARALVQEYQYWPSVLQLQTDFAQCLFPTFTIATSPLLVPFTLNFTITNLQYEENMGHPGSRKFNTTERVLQGTGPLLLPFTLNFTINNLQYEEDMGRPGSRKFNTTERVLQGLLRPLFKNTSVGALYSGCRLTLLRESPSGSAQAFVQEHQCWPSVLWLQTDLTQPSYSLPSPSPTAQAPVQEHQCWPSVLWLQTDLAQLRPLFKNTSVGPLYSGCRLTLLRMDPMLVTVKALFSSYLDPSLVEQVFIDKTLNASSHWLSSTYQLVDIHVTEMEPSVYQPTKPTSSSSTQHFYLNFTITNLPYSQDISQPSTTNYQRNKRNIEDALNQLFRNSSIKSYFSDCQVSTFRSVPNSHHTGVDSLCNFSPLARRVDRVAIYEEFLRMTRNGSQLQNFTLDRSSVLVDGYSPNRNEPLTGNSDLPFWAIILICLAVLLGLITCLISGFLVTTRRRKKEEEYSFRQQCPGYYQSHLDLEDLQ